jgi:FkbM family methyltransferase
MPRRNKLKFILRKILNNLGYEVRKIGSPVVNPVAKKDFWNWLRAYGNIKSVIDIGANNGEFAEFISTYFAAKITIAIEPLPGYDILIKERLNKIPNLHVFNCAISDQIGTTQFRVNPYSPASSLLETTSFSTKEFPQVLDQEHQKLVDVEIKRLDDILKSLELEENLLIKVDVQGLEDKVIKGGLETFKRASFVLIEMSFIEMYLGQPLFEEVHQLLRQCGFRFSGIKNQIDAPSSGQPLFAHCLYVNESFK